MIRSLDFSFERHYGKTNCTLVIWFSGFGTQNENTKKTELPASNSIISFFGSKPKNGKAKYEKTAKMGHFFTILFELACKRKPGSLGGHFQNKRYYFATVNEGIY